MLGIHSLIIHRIQHHPIPNTFPRHQRRSGLFPRSSPPFNNPPSRHDSFLPIDASGSRPILSIPFPHNRHDNRNNTRTSSSTGRNRHVTSPANASLRPSRARTKTEPFQSERQHAIEASRRGSRRFSLSSALSSHHLEMLRTAVSPHPPLPPLPPRPPFFSTSGQSIQGRRSDEISSRLKGTTAGPAGMVAVPTSLKDAQSSQDNVTQLPISPLLGPLDSPIPARMHQYRAKEQCTPQLGSPLLSTPDHSPGSTRNRRSSLASAFSRRAKNMINVVGRRFGEDEHVGSEPTTPISHPRTPKGRPRGASIVTADGIYFDMLTPSPPIDRRFGIRGGSETDSMYYDADDRDLSPSLQESELDTMSFAQSPGPSSFQFSSTASLGVMPDPAGYSSLSSLTRRDGADETIIACSTKGLAVVQDAQSMINEGSDKEEVKEARGFVQTLGLEFDEIARRARENTL